MELADLARKKELACGQEKKRLHRSTSNGEWLSDITHCLNGKDLSQKEFRYNICLIYGLMPQDIPTTCDGCGNKFLIEHTISCPKGGIVLARHDDAAKVWGSLGAWSLFPSAISYKPKISSSSVQGR